MDINVSCEKCGDSLEVIREWSDRSGIEITVMPCKCCPTREQVESAPGGFVCLNRKANDER